METASSNSPFQRTNEQGHTADNRKDYYFRRTFTSHRTLFYNRQHFKANLLLEDLKITIDKREITKYLDYIFIEARKLEQKLLIHLKTRNIH